MMETLEQVTDQYGEPIYVYIPEPHIVANKDNGCAEEYHIFRHADAIGGIIVYGKYNQGFHANPWSTRFLVAHLLNNQKPLADNRAVTVDILLEYGFEKSHWTDRCKLICIGWWKDDLLLSVQEDGTFSLDGSDTTIGNVEQLKALYFGLHNGPLTKPTRCIDRLLGT